VQQGPELVDAVTARRDEGCSSHVEPQARSSVVTAVSRKMSLKGLLSANVTTAVRVCRLRRRAAEAQTVAGLLPLERSSPSGLSPGPLTSTMTLTSSPLF
jgi:hypothetical protein